MTAPRTDLSTVLVLMPCGGAKLDRRARLFDLYQGPMWQTLRTHLGAIPQRNVFVLSAKFGLRSVYEIRDPYEQRMTAARAAQLKGHGVHGFDTIRRNNVDLPMNDSVYRTVHADAPYRTVIVAGGGLYREVLLAWVAELQAEGLVAADAVVQAVAGGIGEQRGQLGAFLRLANAAPMIEAATEVDEVEAAELAADERGAAAPAVPTARFTVCGLPQTAFRQEYATMHLEFATHCLMFGLWPTGPRPKQRGPDP